MTLYYKVITLFLVYMTISCQSPIIEAFSGQQPLQSQREDITHTDTTGTRDDNASHETRPSLDQSGTVSKENYEHAALRHELTVDGDSVLSPYESFLELSYNRNNNINKDNENANSDASKIISQSEQELNHLQTSDNYKKVSTIIGPSEQELNNLHKSDKDEQSSTIIRPSEGELNNLQTSDNGDISNAKLMNTDTQSSDDSTNSNVHTSRIDGVIPSIDKKYNNMHAKQPSVQGNGVASGPRRLYQHRRSVRSSEMGSMPNNVNQEQKSKPGHNLPFRRLVRASSIEPASGPHSPLHHPNRASSDNKINYDQGHEPVSGPQIPLHRHARASNVDPNNPYMQVIQIATVLPADDERLFSIKRVAPAIEYAIEKMNPMLAKVNRTLTVRFRDSKCDIADGINEAINFYVENEMDVLFGPCCDYAVAPCARQVRYWNIPMITAGALAGDFGLAKHSVFSTLTRLGSNFNTLVRFFIDVLTHYKWKKLKVIYNPFGQTDISSKFCHIAANDIHYGFRSDNSTADFKQTYEKFEDEDEILNNLPEKIGLQCSGKCLVVLD